VRLKTHDTVFSDGHNLPAVAGRCEHRTTKQYSRLKTPVQNDTQKLTDRQSDYRRVAKKRTNVSGDTQKAVVPTNLHVDFFDSD
jgi:hypothetical protein